MSQLNRASVATQITTKLADNTSGAITEAKLREVLIDLNDSAYNPLTDGAPSGGGPHTHAQSDITGLTTALAGKAATSHTHAVSDVTGLQAALDGKQAAGSYAASSHTHSIANVTGLQAAIDLKADATALHSHTNKTTLDKITESGGAPQWNGGAWPGGGGGGGDMFKSVYDTNNDGKVDSAASADAVAWSGVTGKPSTFTPASHSHIITEISGLTTVLDNKADTSAVLSGLSGKSDTGHTHSIANVTGLQAALDAKQASGSYATQSGSETFTNKRITKRVSATTTTATLTPASDNFDVFKLTAQTGNLSIANPTGTPTDDQGFQVLVRASGGPRQITLSGNKYSIPSGSSFTSPYTLDSGTSLRLAFVYDGASDKWQLLAAIPGLA